MLRAGTGAVIEAGSWDAPPVFAWLAAAGDIRRDEMFRVFNMGVGMAVMVTDVLAARAVLAEHGLDAPVIGRVEAGTSGLRIA